jgi:hypothetical protein
MLSKKKKEEKNKEKLIINETSNLLISNKNKVIKELKNFNCKLIRVS